MLALDIYAYPTGCFNQTEPGRLYKRGCMANPGIGPRVAQDRYPNRVHNSVLNFFRMSRIRPE